MAENIDIKTGDDIVTITLYRGQENSIYIKKANDVEKENGFLCESYRNAFHAVGTYLKQADKLSKELRESDITDSLRNNILYRSPQNIIVFSGKRGTGKTSTMLSFAKSLEEYVSDNKDNVKDILDRGYVVLNPIDPTMLEDGQNILNVVLSRLIFKARESWDRRNYFQEEYPERAKEKMIY